jgi:putative ABC transport system permease protein
MEFGELIKLSLTAIRANKLRSALTLLGIVVGVFSIIGVMTAVRVLQNSIEEGLSNLGSNTFQIQKMPALFTGGHAQWEKFHDRKDITIEQAEIVAERMTKAEFVGLEAFRRGGVTVEVGSRKTNPNVMVFGENPEGIPTNGWIIEQGQMMTISSRVKW